MSSLFICKIYDEWHNENDGIAQFAWQDDDNPEKFMTRLTELYEKAIDKFLNKKVLGLRSLDDLNLKGVSRSSINEIKELQNPASASFRTAKDRRQDRKTGKRNIKLAKRTGDISRTQKCRFTKMALTPNF
jgi:hypothetical protein